MSSVVRVLSDDACICIRCGCEFEMRDIAGHLEKAHGLDPRLILDAPVYGGKTARQEARDSESMLGLVIVAVTVAAALYLMLLFLGWRLP